MNRAWIRTALASWLAVAPIYSPLALAGDGDDEDEAATRTETVTARERDQQLRRNTGQTVFLSARHNYAATRGVLMAAAAGAAPEAAVAKGELQSGTAKREIVESDVYAVDPETGTLYLLNNQRGLQAVSKGNELLGRAAATGNHPDNMYPVFQNGVKRLVVLEQDWQERYSGQGGGQNGSPKIQLVVYDVSDPSHPKMVQSLPLEGTLADSKLVGDVLYVAASVRPEYYGYGPQPQESKGRVYSVKVTGEQLELAGEPHEIGLPQVIAEMMQIVETPVGNDKYTYHLLALSPGPSMTKREWSWERGSAVEVVDITDPHGKAKSVLKVNARGHVAKRTQVTLQDGHLVVASNYIAKEGNWNSTIRRVAVESWSLPKDKGNKVVPEVDATYRKSYVEVELAKAKVKGADEDELDELRETLQEKKDTGLRGVFVRSDDPKKPLTKLVPDSSANTGDTQGQSASLRDVRFDGANILAFWVPGNMVDPLDFFTLIDGKVTYLNRTVFDGWIETARILHYGGKTFILGLGFTVPPANNSRGRRYPQAKLFEVVREGDQQVAKAIATHVIQDKNMWPSLSGPDKFIDARMNDAGDGSIMFTVATTNKGNYVQGGKLLGFDLKKAVAGKGDQVFTEGALLAGNASWLRRIFVDSVNLRRLAFSDQQLSDYGSVTKGVGSAREIRDAVAKLELARNLQGYVTLGKERTLGVQIVSDSAYWWMNTSTQTTELRLVSDSHADAEKAQVQQTLELKGSYLAHATVDHGTDGQEMLVLVKRTTEKGKTEGEEEDPWQAQYQKQWETTYALVSVREQGGKLVQREAATWTRDGMDYGYYGFGLYRGYGRNALGLLTTLDDGSVVIGGNEKLQRVTFKDWGSYKVEGASGKVPFPAWELSDFTVEGAPAGVDVRQSLIRLGGTGRDAEFALAWQVPVAVNGEDANTSPLSYYRTYLAPVKAGETGYTLGTAVNIAGEPAARLPGGYLLTEEQVYQDRAESEEDEGTMGVGPVGLTPASVTPTAGILPRPGRRLRPRNNVLFTPSILSLKLTAKTATLADIKPADGRSLDAYRQLGNLGPLVTFQRQERGGYYPLGGFRGGIGIGMPYYGAAPTASLEFLSVDANGALRFGTRAANGVTLTDYPQLVDVVAAKKGSFYAVVMEGNRLQVVSIDSKTGQTEVVGLLPVDERGVKASEPVASTYVPHSYWWGWRGRPTAYNPAQRNLTVTAGLAGICQVYLAEEGAKIPTPKRASE